MRRGKRLRKLVQEKLIKFATCSPVAMYLTNYREQKLWDMIAKIEPELLKGHRPDQRRFRAIAQSERIQ